MTAPPEQRDAVPCLQWTVHPAARDPARTALLLLIIALAAVATLAVSGSGLLVLLAVAFLAVSLRAWFLPRTYVLDGEGAREAGPLQAPRALPWREVRRVTAERHGVHVSPLLTASRWLPDRGLFLRTDGNGERVLAFVRARQGAA